ncbi:c-type cytochrome biogenesis protein CcmI [Roseovarius faecimaris]|uniref:C-type cytochrome biogenesis protein CcmI n=1 Tax=Roseovarius faecimaris TaxID=2494550 RepID=A0A6I6IRE5_9RHOB|nr:c-type cytochrome biogenesis protein CcmI [Roseovarius faecimaris]QGX98792.1 c-type cytochrome biogenesis protein CcmI [Roseovarius faecimaris]
MIFWLIILVMGLCVAAVIARAVLTGRTGAITPAAYDLQVYRDQLKEVERDLARGVLTPEEAERLKVEVSRRILAADAQAREGGESGGQPQAVSQVLAGLLVLVLIGGAGFVYSQIGGVVATESFPEPYRDLPIEARLARSEELRANRLSQADAVAEAADLPELPRPEIDPSYQELMEKLRDTVAERPDDAEGLSLLARNEARIGNVEAAIAAQEKLLALLGDEASANEHAFYADQLIVAAGGYVSQEAREVLRTALERNPREPIARYYLAQYFLQVDRPDAAFRTMEALLNDSTPDAPWLPLLRRQIEDVAWRAGVEYQLPPTAEMPGPDAAAMAAAEDMTAEDRQAMIEGMVAQLSYRLATEGGTAQEWARLIRALAVIGKAEQAEAIWQEAETIFGGREEELALIRAAAADAGLGE